MTIKDALAILELALGLIKTVVTGTPAEGGVTVASILEQMFAKVYAAYQSEVGQPMDLNKLMDEPPIA